MEQTVYGDLLFFVNFCMDFQCLFLTARLLRRPFRIFRGVLAAALGALYACAALFLVTTAWLSLLLDLSVGALMCLLVFAARGTSAVQCAVPLALYFGVSFAVGGVMSGMAGLVSRLDLPAVQSGADISSTAFFLLAALGGGVTFLFARLCQKKAKEMRATLSLSLLGKRTSVKALVDTGNLLSDPASGRPVVILRRDVAREWLPTAFPERGEDVLHMATLPPALARRARLVPTATVTGEGLMLVFLPDEALLDAGRGAHAVELLVGAAPLEGVSDDFAAIIPAALITE